MMRALGFAVLAALAIACGNSSSAKPDDCGDGIVSGDEACDDGADNGAGGCTELCTFACVDAVADCGAAPSCQVATCTADHVCIFVADATQDGQSCGTGTVCDNGSCVSEGVCGDGIVQGTEACDFGTSDNGTNTGCEADCTLSCADATACNDMNTCNGVETCDQVTVNGVVGQRCVAGTPENDGTSCGTGLICDNEQCVAGTCGDSFTTTPEECDDANATPGDGCENNCTYSCVSTDTSRNCTPADPCKGQGTCDDGTHTCTPGTPLDDDTPCGTGGYCKTGTCTQPVCPNGVPEPGETCDDGNMTDGDGCDNDCTYSCVTPATDCGTAPACQMWTCSAGHVCQAVADAGQDGTTCGTSGETCNSGACTGGVCGNGIPEAGEQCDFGTANNGPNTGCETDCTLSCATAMDCDDSNTCNGTEACSAVTVNGNAGMRCVAGTAPPENTACGTGKICKSEACVNSVCGDNYIDAMLGETCEPPNTASCDVACNAIACGNGIRSLDEQCDDGNTTNLDGCSSTCKFEQCQRVIDLDMRFDTSSYCPKNQLGSAPGSIAQGLVLDAIDAGVADGSITVLFQLLGLDDLTGTSDPSVSLGVLGGAPVAGTGYDGTNDLDWWYTVDPLDLSGARTPLATIPGSIVAKELNTTASNMSFTVNFVGVDVTMDMFNTTIRAPIGPATTPTMAAGTTTPGHLTSENLDPALTSFVRMGRPDDPATMANEYLPIDVCGATAASSLANTKIPTTVVSYCNNYTIGHSLLDLYIGGCNYFVVIQVIKATQPDTSKTPNVTYTFQANAMRYVTSCKKFVSGVEQTPPPTLAECLDNAGYTSYYKMLTDRVIGK